MTWQAYEVILRLRSPLHSGWRKVGNLQMTRPYVTGRMLWGALTMRFTRDALQGRGPATDSKKYRECGEKVHQNLAFTYFYPAVKTNDGYQVIWPWEDESAFRRRFLSSYPGTALSYPQQSAEEGSLHEVEFIAPHTLDTGEKVFLKGYVFEQRGSVYEARDCNLDWRLALKRLQLGGERGYGWGAVELVTASQVQDNHLFDGHATFRDNNEHPIISLPKGSCLLAHTPAADLPAAGDVEPLVGREWRSDNARRRYAGQYVAFSDICFTPGSLVHKKLDFEIQEFGMWQVLDDKA